MDTKKFNFVYPILLFVLVITTVISAYALFFVFLDICVGLWNLPRVEDIMALTFLLLWKTKFIRTLFKKSCAYTFVSLGSKIYPFLLETGSGIAETVKAAKYYCLAKGISV